MRAAILLAAGGSRRFGRDNKLLARIGGKPLVAHALAIARAAPVGRVIVVTGAQSARVAAAVHGARVTTVHARDHRAGLAASLRAGLAALRPREREAFVFLGDMPAVPSRLAGRLARMSVPGEAGVRPVHRGTPGHPVLLRVPPRAGWSALAGDRGMAPLLRGLRTIPAPRGAILDLDRRSDRAARAFGGRTAKG